jgi:hypothetical protein
MRTQSMNLNHTDGACVRGMAMAEGWYLLAAALDRTEAAIKAPLCMLSVAITRLGAAASCDVAVVVRGSCRRIMHVAAGDLVQLHVPPGTCLRLVCVRHDSLMRTLDLQAAAPEEHHAIELTPRSWAIQKAIAACAGRSR